MNAPLSPLLLCLINAPSYPPYQHTLPPYPITIRYDDDDTLIQLNEAIGKVNRKALEDFQGDETSINSLPHTHLPLTHPRI